MIVRLMADSFPATRFLDEIGTRELSTDMARLGIAGGAVYDALVGATARRNGLTLFTRDRRAKGTYDALGVRVTFID